MNRTTVSGPLWNKSYSLLNVSERGVFENVVTVVLRTFARIAALFYLIQKGDVG